MSFVPRCLQRSEGGSQGRILRSLLQGGSLNVTRGCLIQQVSPLCDSLYICTYI